ncbi:MAG: hypothetical protein E6248_09640 [Clostridium sp.]|uniref:hypothetical protein n=1 Tax=Clostridium sp. TaxID=1506 RepID=UPI0029090C5D|nr:hypothetical protein [Clostridium sp.]MDU5110700.1 hypothetical protein [Clostridium sp.]
MKKALFVFALTGVVIAVSSYVNYSNTIKEEVSSNKSITRSGKSVVDIKSGETIFTNLYGDKNMTLLNKGIALSGMSRSGSAVVDLETGEVISRSEYSN